MIEEASDHLQGDWICDLCLFTVALLSLLDENSKPRNSYTSDKTILETCSLRSVY